MVEIKVWTWNVNSIRKKVALVNRLLIKENIDILVVTETKIQENNIPEVESQINPFYQVFWNCNKNNFWHGIAVIHKKELKPELLFCQLESKDNISFQGHKEEGRILVLKFNWFILVGTYVPNSGVDKKEPLKRLEYRVTQWDPDLFNLLNNLKETYGSVIWTGDMNVAHYDDDLPPNLKTTFAGITAAERLSFHNFMEGWIDTWNILNPTITDWRLRSTYVSGINLRIDYNICSPVLKDHLVSSTNLIDYEGSDHIPIGTTYRF